MELKYKDMIRALNDIEDERNIPENIVLDALKEAIAKAYKKDSGIEDINVEAEINEKKKTIDIYQLYNVVENVEDDEMEMDLPTAREIKPDAILGDVIRRQVEINGMSRAAATLARSVMKQKIREAEKVSVYDAYIDQLSEMVIGVVESVKDRFVLVNLGKTTGFMPRPALIPGEHLYEGQKLRVVITEVNKDSKNSQVLVSRADAMLVKRLFEKEIPEISDGVIEIKAIAREAGERTKMAVCSYDPNVDPIGACIGQRGARVQTIIEELHGEKIDIFQWSDDITVLVKNALAPADVIAVVPGNDDKSLLVIVAEDQLSLAIGKKGKNARLAVKLTGRKIDIKTKSEIEELGMDYDALIAKAEELKSRMQEEQIKRAQEHQEAVLREQEAKRAEKNEALMKAKAQEAAAAAAQEDFLPAEMQEVMSERIRDDVANNEPESEEEETAVETPAVAAPVETVEVVEEAVEEPVQEEPVEEEKPVAKKRKKADLEEMAANNDYVSVFEKLANTKKPKAATSVNTKKKRKKTDDEGVKLRNDELLKQLKNTNTDLDANKPIYTEEELEEIARNEEEEEARQYDIDYDEYADYYDEEQ